MNPSDDEPEEILLLLDTPKLCDVEDTILAKQLEEPEGGDTMPTFYGITDLAKCIIIAAPQIIVFSI